MNEEPHEPMTPEELLPANAPAYVLAQELGRELDVGVILADLIEALPGDELPPSLRNGMPAPADAAPAAAETIQWLRRKHALRLEERTLRKEDASEDTTNLRNRLDQLAAPPAASSAETHPPPASGETIAADTATGMSPTTRPPLPWDQQYDFPSPDLLEPAVEEEALTAATIQQAEEQQVTLQSTLDSFGIDAQVREFVAGPRVTLYRIEPAEGVRVEAISNITRNIAMRLEAESIRVEAPIPGEPFVGIEVPNKTPAPVHFRSIIEDKAWAANRAKIPLALGRDIRGKAVILDLHEAPHLLIAGATGSGKSVCMNGLIMSLIYRFSPAELRLILIDPKIVEFSMYSALPHLITPVVTEPQKVISALNWAMRETERRYKVMAEVGARNITGYHRKRLEYQKEGREIEAMPFIVVIVDELADIMLTAGMEVEKALARIAQLSRAVGIHAIVATQRPSVNVITGVIKANFPTRIAFQVTSQIDSRTILDSKGAETLQGKGDMLFSPPGIGGLNRIQGSMIHEEEIERVVEAVSSSADPAFDPLVISDDNRPAEAGAEEETEEDEELVQKAAEIVRRDQRASTSYLQRRLKIGYNRAASIMEILEDRGVVGPQVGTAPREIF
ncbi:MAG: DNA translocase FtsK [Verrucomicrobiota bacterium]|nr:DNA translocase FtsK [Verrucomicrobiota bacterium]MDI9385288.1 DNA translocase FtsK [Verrucomicrobiota bacterium]